MDFKTVCILFVALAIVSIEASTVNVNTASTNPDVSPVDATGSATAYLRSKRQFYPGYGGGNAFAASQASAGSFGGGGLGGFGASNAFASSSAGAGSGFLGKKK